MLKFSYQPKVIFKSNSIAIYETKKNKIKITQDQTVIILNEKDSNTFNNPKSFAARNSIHTINIDHIAYIIRLEENIFFHSKFFFEIDFNLEELLKDLILFFSKQNTKNNNEVISEMITSSLKCIFQDDNDIISQIESYIMNNLSNQELSPSNIASYFSISIRKLYYIFNENNLSISNYIKEKRLEKLRYLLKTKNLTQKELQKQCGFRSVYIMNANYKKKYNSSIQDKFKQYREHER